MTSFQKRLVIYALTLIIGIIFYLAYYYFLSLPPNEIPPESGPAANHPKNPNKGCHPDPNNPKIDICFF